MKPITRSSFALAAALLALPLTGCGPRMPSVTPVRLANLASATSLPMVIQFDEGDRIPIDVMLSGDLVSTEKAPQAPVLVVKKRFYLVIFEDGQPRISLDGKTLGGARGSFAFGVGVDKEKGTKVNIHLTVVEKR